MHKAQPCTLHISTNDRYPFQCKCIQHTSIATRISSVRNVYRKQCIENALKNTIQPISHFLEYLAREQRDAFFCWKADLMFVFFVTFFSFFWFFLFLSFLSFLTVFSFLMSFWIFCFFRLSSPMFLHLFPPFSAFLPFFHLKIWKISHFLIESFQIPGKRVHYSVHWKFIFQNVASWGSANWKHERLAKFLKA